MLQNWCECPEVSTLYLCFLLLPSCLSVMCAQVGRRRSHTRRSLSSRPRSSSAFERVQRVHVLRGSSRQAVTESSTLFCPVFSVSPSSQSR